MIPERKLLARMTNKIYNLQELKGIVEKLKKEKKKIVLANGCFDILHVGHVRYLEEAKKLGDILIVAINSDESVRKIKGEKRPIVPGKERAEIISALKVVDFVIIFDELDVRKLLLELKPHIQVKGTDYTEESVPERDVVLSYGGSVKITGDSKNHSSKDIISTILEKFCKK